METVSQVRFAIFNEPEGPKLDCEPVGLFGTSSLGSNHGVRYRSIKQLVEALDRVGLPGKEIFSGSLKVYSVTSAQLRALRLKAPNKQAPVHPSEQAFIS